MSMKEYTNAKEYKPIIFDNFIITSKVRTVRNSGKEELRHTVNGSKLTKMCMRKRMYTMNILHMYCNMQMSDTLQICTLHAQIKTVT